jgi:alpha-amylase
MTIEPNRKRRCDMGVLLQAFFTTKGGNKGVPCPLDGDHGAPFWWDHLADQAHALRQVGFTAVWLPPPLKAGAGVASVGYDVFDDYDLGSKNQKGHVATRYGTREQLARCVAMLRANGLDVYVDLVENQRDGESGPGEAVFRYADADGHVGDPRHDGKGGRFPKDPGCFHFVHGGVPQDPHVFQDFSFGRDLAPVNGKPPGYVANGLRASADWLVRALDLQGFRVDDVKGISTDFLLPLLNHGAVQGKFAVGEFFDGNLTLVRNWVSNPNGMRGRSSAFDFPLRDLLFQICNNAGFFDMSHLDHAGLAGADPLHAVTFVENHDTDKGGGAIRQKKAQAYAYILTSEGYPCVFYKDYSTDPGCFGMKKTIDNLIWIHEKLAEGPTQQRWKDHDVFAYERLGGAHLLVGLNNNGAAAHTITVDTGFGPNVPLHDYTGHANDAHTDGQGRVTITIPRNEGGFGYVCYSRAGFGGGFPINSHSVTQDYEGAPDLDIKPADTTPVQVCRVWSDAGKVIHGALHFDTSSFADDTTLLLELRDAAGAVLASRTFTRTTAQGESIQAPARTKGWHSFHIRAANTPAANRKPTYKLTVTYTAPHSGTGD